MTCCVYRCSRSSLFRVESLPGRFDSVYHPITPVAFGLVERLIGSFDKKILICIRLRIHRGTADADCYQPVLAPGMHDALLRHQ